MDFVPPAPQLTRLEELAYEMARWPPNDWNWRGTDPVTFLRRYLRSEVARRRLGPVGNSESSITCSSCGCRHPMADRNVRWHAATQKPWTCGLCTAVARATPTLRELAWAASEPVAVAAMSALL